MTELENWSSTSTVISSIGSSFIEFSFLNITFGLDNDSSNPLFALFQSILQAEAPLPPTSNESFFSFSLKVIATFVSDPRISLSLIRFEVILFPLVQQVASY